MMAREGLVRAYVCRKLFNYGKDTSRSLLLFMCYPEELEVYELGKTSCLLKLRCRFANQGLPYLHNHLTEEKEGRPADQTYLRSVTDPEYVLPLHEQLSQAPLVNMLVCEQSVTTLLILQTSLNDFYVYKLVQHQNELGGVFVRTVLPVYAQKPTA